MYRYRFDRWSICSEGGRRAFESQSVGPLRITWRRVTWRSACAARGRRVRVSRANTTPTTDFTTVLFCKYASCCHRSRLRHGYDDDDLRRCGGFPERSVRRGLRERTTSAGVRPASESSVTQFANESSFFSSQRRRARDYNLSSSKRCRSRWPLWTDGVDIVQEVSSQFSRTQAHANSWALVPPRCSWTRSVKLVELG